MYHKPTPEVAAGAIPEVEAEAGVIAGVAVRAILEVALRVYNQGPLVGPNPGGS